MDSTFGLDCASDGERVFVYGGAKLSAAPAVFSASTQTWAESFNTSNAPATYGATAAWHGNKVLHFGGGTYPITSFVSELAEYDTSAQKWEKRSTPPLEPRGFSASVWTGTRFLVWGGLVPKSAAAPPVAYANGASYDPATDAWTPISTAGAPSPRGFHAAAWTGSRMLIWGGTDETLAAVGGGAAYDPATDTWKAISTSGAPSPRVAFGWTWAKGRLHIWGGSPKLNAPALSAGPSGLGDGASYDPETDTWTPINPEGAPSPRTAVAIASDGKQLFVWGGSPGSAGVIFPIGALYDLDTKKWSQATGCIGTLQIYQYGHCLSFLGTGFFSAGGEAMPEGYWFVAP